MKNNELSVVLPLHPKDIPRFDILKKSIERYFEFEGPIYTVVPDKFIHKIQDYIKNDRFIVIGENALVPELEGNNSIGWWKQQIIKLAIANVIETPFYLTLDSDCIAVRPLKYKDFVKNNKGIIHYESKDLHLSWYENSAKILQLPIPTRGIGATPFVFAKDLVQKLFKYLETIYPKYSWAKFLALTRRQQVRIDQQKKTFLYYWPGCTEYTLYYTYAAYAGKIEEYHFSGTIFGNCIWYEEDENWDVKKSFENPNFLFSVLQSACGPSIKEIEEMLKEYLP